MGDGWNGELGETGEVMVLCIELVREKNEIVCCSVG